MVSLVDLWLPILLSTVFVFLASSVIHMMIPIHKDDYKPITDEEAFRKVVGSQNLSPGYYCFPFCRGMKELGEEGMIAKYKEGPVGFMTIVPSGAPTMNKALLQWFFMALLMSALAGLMCTMSLPEGAAYMSVFKIAFFAACLGYSGNCMTDSIWKGQPWGNTFRFIFDGVVYALVTAGTFGWLWPEAAIPVPGV